MTTGWVRAWPTVAVCASPETFTSCAAACATVTLEPPELVSAADKVWLWPSCTLPKLRLDGFELSAPEAVATAETGTFTTVVDASVVTAILPLALPAACGAKVTLKLLRCPAARVKGKLMPLILKPLPVTVAWRMVS